MIFFLMRQEEILQRLEKWARDSNTPYTTISSFRGKSILSFYKSNGLECEIKIECLLDDDNCPIGIFLKAYGDREKKHSKDGYSSPKYYIPQELFEKTMDVLVGMTNTITEIEYL